MFKCYSATFFSKYSVKFICNGHGAVLSAGAAEADRQIGEAAFHVALHGSVDKGVGMLQEYGYLAVVFQEADNGFVQSREGFVTLVLAGVVHSAAVEDKTSTVARRIFGDAFLVGKAHHLDGKLFIDKGIMIERLERD